MKSNRRKHFSVWDVRCYAPDGSLMWEELNIPNMLQDEGELFILEVVFTQGASVPAAYYLGLDDRPTLTETDTLATVAATEPVGDGYARQAVNSDAVDWTITQDAGDYQAASKTVTFTAAGGTIGPVKNLFLCNVASGTVGSLIASVELSQQRTMPNAFALEASMIVKLTE